VTGDDHEDREEQPVVHERRARAQRVRPGVGEREDRPGAEHHQDRAAGLFAGL